jgi:photosystem II stability/assembly factor-like uncharacterized protein
VKAVAALLTCALAVSAQSPIHIDYACTSEDEDSFGLSCSPEEPCPVFLDLASVDAAGTTLVVAGNLHTERTTLWGILLQSDDGGKSWTEPLKRLRAAAFEQIQFLDFGYGWVSGEIIEPLPKDPFLLLTTDGGKTWRQHPLFEDSRFASVAQFWFDSRTTGKLVLDHPQGGATPRHEVYETNTGGESWELNQVTDKPVNVKGAGPREAATWRVRAEASSKTYRLERRGSPNWETVASFVIHVTDCK